LASDIDAGCAQLKRRTLGLPHSTGPFVLGPSGPDTPAVGCRFGLDIALCIASANGQTAHRKVLI
jgi:hypothetical protein